MVTANAHANLARAGVASKTAHLTLVFTANPVGDEVRESIHKMVIKSYTKKQPDGLSRLTWLGRARFLGVSSIFGR